MRAMCGALQRSSAAATARRSMATYLPVPDKLTEVVHLSLLQEQPSEDLRRIWSEYHGGVDSAANVTGSVLDGDSGRLVFERGSSCPIFVLPLQRDGGYMVMLSQFKAGHLNLTYLEDFRNHPNAAEPYMTARLYTDFLEDKGLVLARAHLDTDRLSREEAEHLLNCFVRVYTTPEMYEYVDQFNNKPTVFNFDDWAKFAMAEGIGCAAAPATNDD
jgi:hypothetical protein